MLLSSKLSSLWFGAFEVSQAGHGMKHGTELPCRMTFGMLTLQYVIQGLLTVDMTDLAVGPL